MWQNLLSVNVLLMLQFVALDLESDIYACCLLADREGDLINECHELLTWLTNKNSK